MKVLKQELEKNTTLSCCPKILGNIQPLSNEE